MIWPTDGTLDNFFSIKHYYGIMYDILYVQKRRAIKELPKHYKKKCFGTFLPCTENLLNSNKRLITLNL